MMNDPMVRANELVTMANVSARATQAALVEELRILVELKANDEAVTPFSVTGRIVAAATALATLEGGR